MNTELIVTPVIGISIIAIILILLLFALLRKSQHYPYERCQSLFTNAEKRFLQVLQKAARDYEIHGKVRLADIVQVKKGLNKSKFFQAFNRIACKHIDYVICAKDNHAILCVIELDDASHKRPDRQRRDVFVDAVMQAAGIPILHFPVQRNYQLKDIKQRLQAVL